MIQDPAHEVVLGGLALMENGYPVEYPEGYTLSVESDDTTWGNPQAKSTTLYSMLSAGSLVSRDPDDNRSPVVRVKVSASGPEGLELGEAALMAVCNKPTTLEWLPPQTGAIKAVFDVVDSSLEFLFDDLDEMRMTRTWRVSMSALPYARDEHLTVSPAVPFVAGTVVDSGSSTTNWTASRPAGASMSVVSGAITSTYDPSLIQGGYYGTNLNRAFATPLDVSVSRYFAVDWKASVPSYHGFLVNGSGGLTEVRRDPLAGGFVRSYYQVPASMTSVSRFDFGIVHAVQPSGSATLSVDQVQVMQALPMIGTARHQLRTIDVGGSAPTQGTIQVTHPSSGLGECIVYSYESQGGYQPVLSPYRILSGEFFADASAVNNGYWDLTSTHRWAIPVDALPHGEAVLMFRAHNTEVGPCTFDWTAFSEMGGGVLGQVSGSFTHTFEVANDPQMVIVPVTMDLPTVPMGPSGIISLDVRRQAIGGPGASYMHEAWLFSTKGSLNIVFAGPRRNLIVRAPSLDEPHGSMWCGDTADGSDWYSVSGEATSRQHHTLKPGINNVYTLTATALDAQVSATHFNRHHTHPKGA